MVGWGGRITEVNELEGRELSLLSVFPHTRTDGGIFQDVGEVQRVCEMRCKARSEKVLNVAAVITLTSSTSMSFSSLSMSCGCLADGRSSDNQGLGYPPS